MISILEIISIVLWLAGAIYALCTIHKLNRKMDRALDGMINEEANKGLDEALEATIQKNREASGNYGDAE